MDCTIEQLQELILKKNPVDKTLESTKVLCGKLNKD
jgi:hypothetical protein